MHSALGLSATEDTISAVLLDVDVDAGSVSPIEERSVQLAATGSGAVGDAVAAAIGVMKLRAARSEQPVGVVGVAYESELQRSAIEHAISSQGINGVRLVWSESPVLDRGLDVATAAAIWAADEARAAGGFTDAGAALVVPVPIVVPPFASRWRNLPTSLVVATVAATVLGGSVASAIALGALGGQQEPVVQVGAASTAATANASPAASTVASSARASVTEAPQLDETTVAYVPPARPESQAEPIPPAPAVVPEPPATVAAPPPASAAEAPAGTSSATRVPAVTPPDGNSSGSGGSGGSGPRATTTTPIPTTTTSTTTTTVEPTTTTSDSGEPPGPTFDNGGGTGGGDTGGGDNGGDNHDGHDHP
ncbi:hypothetical protein [Millisia brevis]|uniref:hypothetical protein n=1 Tax=Millisia brevis TaxID=264148 RepID=UPI000833DAE8|nr:hypothetical protein [Millisia brevis]